MARKPERYLALALSAAMAATLTPAAPLALASTSPEDTAAPVAAGENADGSAEGTADTAESGGESGQETQLSAEEQKAADEVKAEIEKLSTSGSKVSGEKAAIAKARSDYDALSDAQRSYLGEKVAERLEKAEDALLYAETPVLTYKMKSPGSSKATTVSDGEAHALKNGIGKIKVSAPVSGTDSKTRLSGSMSYGVKVYGAKTQKASKSSWIGSNSTSKAVQAFRLKFGGKIAKHYDVYYRAKVAKLGWGDWAENGSWAGSTGMNLRLTGLQVKFVKKGASAPGATGKPCLGKTTISYRVNPTKGGWGSYKAAGKTAGTASWKAGIGQVQLETKGDVTGSAKVSVLERTGSWTAYTTGAAGSTAKSKQAQAVRIKLTGKLAKVYDVYYRVYASDWHWLGWAKNGQKAGTQGHNYTMGAIQVKLVLKGAGAPGKTSGRFTTRAVPYTAGGELTMTRRAQSFSSPTSWLVLVNRNTTHVGVFKGSKNDWTLVRYMQCDVGSYSTPTPTGTRHVQYRIPSFGENKGYSVYKATNIGGGYYFHSILYYANTRSVMDGTLGAWCSHGCIRLAYSNAKYIYDHVSNGTTVKIY